mmetsp:Transcript_7202/g.16474  ORF Transcript_7202/g.16474 Transcript_7202/m.16474 type:complete len:397 (-) Transcript_7202:115-1305(-)|eukprot:CAMPEP_0172602516 /NCGR_PEP_ID=MMETSP1068-20121228/22689_1 /TAXON_ID=35684 /ORGANISM="Pseudopedinella elastica, Strain CCMP716" /LENGTH=396 /DNA_ID=CAMNT_0013403889 /DNA_START=181 /DNA_END=1371 /DNA_ORIENTATION=-
MPMYRQVSSHEDEEGAASGSSEKGSCAFVVFIVLVLVVLILGAVDSFTTHFFKAGCLALAAWTMDNAPGSFVIFELIIALLIVCCLPYGPLAVLSGALFYQKYGGVGVVFAWAALFLVTFTAALVCFFLARYAFKGTVQAKISKNPKLGFLKNLDKLVSNGQGIEMVILIRIAPLPKGPTNYFLGTTQVTWRDFVIGSVVVGLPECLLDVCIGAGAKGVKHDSPMSVGIFVLLVTVFLGLMCYVGARAQAKLKALDGKDGEAGDDPSALEAARRTERKRSAEKEGERRRYRDVAAAAKREEAEGRRRQKQKAAEAKRAHADAAAAAKKKKAEERKAAQAQAAEERRAQAAEKRQSQREAAEEKKRYAQVATAKKRRSEEVEEQAAAKGRPPAKPTQ